MRKILTLSVLITFFACGGSGIDGYVGESISITAENPEEGKDMDYNWTLANQPDGSLMNSSDLFASDDGQKMSFIPDYPGDYSVKVSISQYGDEVETQTFAFSILDPSESDEESDDDLEKETDDSNEEWLNEDLEKETVANDEDDLYEDEDSDDEYDSDEDESEDYTEDEDDSDEDSDEPVAMVSKSTHVKAKATLVKMGASIAEKTDRYTIQITSKRMLLDAQKFSHKLISKGYDAYIQKAAFNGSEIWYRVRVGSYDSYNSAKSAADILSGELGMATWVDFVRKEQ